ncbi:hypothetical protein [Pseudomonas sp. EMN2]|uniref:hypothetical protein n=1 Tax=Pseudomonas sp. EMN2 TaxID=2615212 RepID=UPI0015B63956|nr:hypothetical protein [Pseudomonas sp. EMN2]
MNVFALIDSPDEPISLTEDIYYSRTNRKWPYVQEVGNKLRAYAVCPSCKNPVRLVNRTATETRSGSFYAKHHKWDVHGVASYDERAYALCDLANPTRMDELKRRLPSQQGRSDEIKEALINAFDIVVSMLAADTGVKMTDGVLEEMLDDFSKNNGHEYSAVNLYNLPYAFAYMTESKDLYGCEVNDVIAAAMAEKSDSFTVKSFGRRHYVRRKPGARGSIRMLFYGHSMSGGESIMMRIVEIPPGADADTATVITQKKIDIDGAKFFNFYRKRQRLIGMARSRLKS